MDKAKTVETVVIDTGTGRTAKFDSDPGSSRKDAVAKAYEEIGEARRGSDHYFDDKGNSIDDSLNDSVGSLPRDQDGAVVIEIRHPTGGGNAALPLSLGGTAG